MKTTSYSLSIPKPCHENWNQMTPENKGRFCLHCQKSVIDFSNMSDEEIIKTIQGSTNLCGRFKTTQLSHPFVNQEYNYKWPNWKGAMIVALLSLFSMKMSALQQRKVITTTQQPFLKSKLPAFEIMKGPDKPNKKVALSGQVVNSGTNEPIIGAMLEIKSNNIQIEKTISDDEGNFMFNVDNMEHIMLSCKYIGYNAVNINLDDSLVHSNIPLKISLAPPMEMEAIITGGISMYYEKPTTLRRVKWFFTRIYNRIKCHSEQISY